MKERPICRAIIIEQGLKPLLRQGSWDSMRGVHSNGTETFLSDGLVKQMKKMILEGHWPELVGIKIGKKYYQV